MKLARSLVGEVIPHQLRHVVIVGMGRSCYDYIREAYHKEMRTEDTQVWTVNAGGRVFRADLVFDMHDLGDKFARVEGTLESGTPVVTTLVPEQYKEQQHLYEYPIAEIVQAYQENYFTNSIAYMLALAHHCGAKKITIYGCDYDYADKPSYESGRPCVEYWMGLLKGLGTQINTGPSTKLLEMQPRIQNATHSFYGYGKRYPITDLGEDGTACVVGFNQPTIACEPLENGDESDAE